MNNNDFEIGELVFLPQEKSGKIYPALGRIINASEGFGGTLSFDGYHEVKIDLV